MRMRNVPADRNNEPKTTYRLTPLLKHIKHDTTF